MKKLLMAIVHLFVFSFIFAQAPIPKKDTLQVFAVSGTGNQTVILGTKNVMVLKIGFTAPSNTDARVLWFNLFPWAGTEHQDTLSVRTNDDVWILATKVITNIIVKDGNDVLPTQVVDMNRFDHDIFVALADYVVIPKGTSKVLTFCADYGDNFQGYNIYGPYTFQTALSITPKLAGSDRYPVYVDSEETSAMVTIGPKGGINPPWKKDNRIIVKLNQPLPVELSSFEAVQAGNGNVELKWTTTTETNNYGFEVEKSYDGTNFEKIGFVAGKGTTTEKQDYSFGDKLKAKEVYYRLKQIDADGKFEYKQAVKVLSAEAEDFQLNQNYPNPFNPKTEINFFVPQQGNVKLAVYDLLGREVAVLADSSMSAGNHSVSFNGASLASGVYLYKLDAGSFSQTKKMTLSK